MFVVLSLVAVIFDQLWQHEQDQQQRKRSWLLLFYMNYMSPSTTLTD